jgi:uncharacterized protein (DUF2147 family)
MKKLLVTTLALAALSASAQMTPVGTWNSVDDVTKAIVSEFVITEKAGVLSGTITKFLRPGADLKKICTKCEDDRKDQLVLGMELIRGGVKAQGKDVWEGGKLLDPDSGSAYTLRLTPIEGGKKLEVRGSVLFISRTQTWLRVN